MLRFVLLMFGSWKSSIDIFETEMTLMGMSWVIVRELTFEVSECRSSSTVRHGV